MNNKEKKMTFDDIIKAKIQKENDKLTVKSIEVPSVGKELLFRRPKDEMVFDFIDNLHGGEEKTEDLINEYAKIIYQCCDTLQDPELHKELEIDDPFDTAKAFMDANDIIVVGDEVASMNSLYSNFEEKVKN